MFGKVSRAKDYTCIEVEGSRDLTLWYFLVIARVVSELSTLG